MIQIRKKVLMGLFLVTVFCPKLDAKKIKLERSWPQFRGMYIVSGGYGDRLDFNPALAIVRLPFLGLAKVVSLGKMDNRNLTRNYYASSISSICWKVFWDEYRLEPRAYNIDLAKSRSTEIGDLDPNFFKQSPMVIVLSAPFTWKKIPSSYLQRDAKIISYLNCPLLPKNAN